VEKLRRPQKKSKAHKRNQKKSEDTQTISQFRCPSCILVVGIEWDWLVCFLGIIFQTLFHTYMSQNLESYEHHSHQHVGPSGAVDDDGGGALEARAGGDQPHHTGSQGSAQLQQRDGDVGSESVSVGGSGNSDVIGQVASGTQSQGMDTPQAAATDGKDIVSENLDSSNSKRGQYFVILSRQLGNHCIYF
jgi:hypothetical protein